MIAGLGITTANNLCWEIFSGWEITKLPIQLVWVGFRCNRGANREKRVEIMQLMDSEISTL